MEPGDLVRSKVTVSLYSANPGTDKVIAKGYEVPGHVFLLVDWPGGTWAKFLYNGNVVWCNVNCFEEA